VQSNRQSTNNKAGQAPDRSKRLMCLRARIRCSAGPWRGDASCWKSIAKPQRGKLQALLLSGTRTRNECCWTREGSCADALQIVPALLARALALITSQAGSAGLQCRRGGGGGSGRKQARSASQPRNSRKCEQCTQCQNTARRSSGFRIARTGRPVGASSL
jgi:hypothetical protein